MDAGNSECDNVHMAPVKKNFGQLGTSFLKEWREASGLDQDEIAERIGVSRTLLSKMENGKTPYTQRTLEAAARVYNCTPAQLLTQNPNRPDSFIPLFEKAEKTEGSRRTQLLAIIAAALN